MGEQRRDHLSRRLRGFVPHFSHLQAEFPRCRAQPLQVQEEYLRSGRRFAGTWNWGGRLDEAAGARAICQQPQLRCVSTCTQAPLLAELPLQRTSVGLRPHRGIGAAHPRPLHLRHRPRLRPLLCPPAWWLGPEQVAERHGRRLGCDLFCSARGHRCSRQHLHAGLGLHLGHMLPIARVAVCCRWLRLSGPPRQGPRVFRARRQLERASRSRDAVR
mmetsp:Transcript_140860/g.351166  ORF Transcript_140860/g.351166 Transcript_140860/m.351166 type:complete len:216 (-) Transcript_140860:72-719(-)